MAELEAAGPSKFKVRLLWFLFQYLSLSVSLHQSFSGQGQRLDGKKNSSHAQKQVQQEPTKRHVCSMFRCACSVKALITYSYRERGIPNYNYRKFKLTFAKAKNLRAAMEEPMVSQYTVPQ